MVLAYKPWLPRPGLRLWTEGHFYFQWDVAEQQPYLLIPPSALSYDDSKLRRYVRHEMGHLWADALSRRRGNSYDIYPYLDIDGAHPQRNEIAAEIFARVMGEQASYPDLEPLTRATAPRIDFVDGSGAETDVTAEKVALAIEIQRFWQRDDIPTWFRVWAANYQGVLDLDVFRVLRLK